MRRDRERAPPGDAGRTPPQAESAGGTRRRWLRLWLVLAVLWAGAMAYACLQSWPTLPLDLPRTDPQVQAVYTRAIAAHLGRYSLLGLAPPLLLLILGWLGFRIARPRD